MTKEQKEQRKKELLFLASAIMYAGILARNGIPNEERIYSDAMDLYEISFGKEP